MSKQNILLRLVSVLAFVLVISASLPALNTKAEETASKGAVSIGAINYDTLTMQVNLNGNGMSYYSVDKTTWYEVEGNKTSDNKSILMDISWIPAIADKVIYLKGDNVTTIISVSIPGKETDFKVIYNKAECNFAFENCGDATSFEWKKASDYNWKSVSLDLSSTSYNNFLKNMESLLLRGGKITLRLPQVAGKSELLPGMRPSKEVTVALTKRANAPAIKVNVAKLYLNTSPAMEYYNVSTKTWIDCDKNMLLADIAPSVLLKNGAKSVTLMIRTAATDKSTYSKTAYITVPGQKAAPTVGGSGTDVTYWYQNKKLVLQFNKASNTSTYGFAIVKPGQTYDATETKFVTVSSTKGRTIAVSAAPEGSIVYVRKMGNNENITKGISLELASELTSITVTYK